jgi:hypothetical protein
MAPVVADERADLRERLVADYLEYCDFEHGLEAKACFRTAEAWASQGKSVFGEREALSMAAHMYLNLVTTRADPELSPRAAARATALYEALRESDPADGAALFGLAHLAPEGPEHIALLEETSRLHPENPQLAYLLGAELLRTEDPAYARTAADALWRAWTSGCRGPTGCTFAYARYYLEALEQVDGPQAAGAARVRIRQSCGADDALAGARRSRERPLHERVATLRSLLGPYCYGPYMVIDEATCPVLVDEVRQLTTDHPDAVGAWEVLAEAIETVNPQGGVTWSGAQISPCQEPAAAAELRPIYSKMLELEADSFRGRWGMASLTPNVYCRLEALVDLARDEPRLTEAQRLSLAEELVLMAWTDEAVSQLDSVLDSTQSRYVRWRAQELLIDAHLEAGDSRAAARVWLEQERAWPPGSSNGPVCRPEPEPH